MFNIRYTLSKKYWKSIIHTFQYLHLMFLASQCCNADPSPTSTMQVCLDEVGNGPRTCNFCKTDKPFRGNMPYKYQGFPLVLSFLQNIISKILRSLHIYSILLLRICVSIIVVTLKGTKELLRVGCCLPLSSLLTEDL